jgi:hypothetical protein
MVLLEDAGLLAQLRDGAFPAAADWRGDLERLGGRRLSERRRHEHRHRCGRQNASRHALVLRQHSRHSDDVTQGEPGAAGCFTAGRRYRHRAGR